MRTLRQLALAALLGLTCAAAAPAGVLADDSAAPSSEAGAAAPARPAAGAVVGGVVAPPPVHYVALGDSYSSGVGAGSHILGSGRCDRSSKAYPALWAAAYHPASFTFAACSGARTGDVAGDQVASLTRATTLVSITVGGNDEGFASVMTDCNLRGTSRCVSEVHHATDDARTTLAGTLAQLFAAIRVRAPHARVVVLGYPHFYDLHDDCFGLSSSSRRAIDGGVDVLDDVLRGAARTAGFRFADVRAGLSGHEICDSAPWLHAVTLFQLSESYHPTAHGQQAFYRAFATAAA